MRELRQDDAKVVPSGDREAADARGGEGEFEGRAAAVAAVALARERGAVDADDGDGQALVAQRDEGLHQLVVEPQRHEGDAP